MMRNAASALLFAATISSQLVASASADSRFGRFGTRFRRSNITTPDAESTSTTKSSLVLSSTESYLTGTDRPSLPSLSLGIVSTDDHDLFPSSSNSFTTYGGAGNGGPYTATSAYIDDGSSSTTFSNHFTGSTRTHGLGVSVTGALSSSSTQTTSRPPISDLYSTGGTSSYSSNSTSSIWVNSSSTSVTPSSTVWPTITTDSPTSSINATLTSLSVDPFESCYSSEEGMPSTIISIVHTSTITWYGDPEDYTAEFPSIDVPTPCDVLSKSRGDTGYAPPSSASVVLSASGCTDGGKSTCLVQVSTLTSLLATTVESAPGMYSWTYTFYTTDKNPAVVFTTSASVPDYGGDENSNGDGNGHAPATQRESSSGVPNYGGTSNSQAAQQMQETASKTDVTVEVRPTEVVINTVTISNNPASSKTTTVTIGTDVFTVGPSSIIGAGATVTRPQENEQAASPTTTTVNGIGVVVSKTVAVVGGTTFTIGTEPSTQTVSGQLVTVGPGGVAVAGITVSTASGASATQVIVAGGELITAIGKSVVVVDGTSYTYGSGTQLVTKVIDDDTITIGPSGVVFDGTTFGGSTASDSRAFYQVVGGATITEVGASVVIIEGVTYTIGPGTGTTTTIAGGETITIGPSGVTISDGMTLTYPFGPTMTTTLHPGATVTAAEASSTNTDSEDEEDSAVKTGKTPNLGLMMISTCIALGVGFFGFFI